MKYLFRIGAALLLYSLPVGAQCGHLSDTGIHVPPNYVTAAVPTVDPTYGCPIQRVTTFGQLLSGQAIHHLYSTASPWNADDTRIMVVNDSGFMAVMNPSGTVAVPVANMPASNNADQPWDLTDPSVFYYAIGNTFRKGTISGNAVISTTLHTFAGFSTVIIPDQEDVSDDGTTIWLIGDHGTECAGRAIAYNLSTDTVLSSSLTLTACHKIQISPSGKMICGACQGKNNYILYNTDGSLYWDMPQGTGSSHLDSGTDLSGKEVLIKSADGDATMSACPELWLSLNVIDIATKSVVRCLINGIPSWHVSYRTRKNSPHGWVILSMFDPEPCPSYACFTLSADWASRWALYTEEIVAVKIDGSAIYRLAHSRSRSADNYWAQPHAAISRDGRFVAFDSNMGISTTGNAQYADVYAIPFAAAVPPPPLQPPSGMQVTVGP